ncbi:helix-turn-helix transcriptional regulator [Rhodobacteraceae bacterium NNCM2]|nr:helix-turn-helix transcriptional regulator [Coraliihabitans acroporae]
MSDPRDPTKSPSEPDQPGESLLRLARADRTPEQAEPLDLGARVRQLRHDRQWTLEEAAKRAGLARSTLSKIENAQMSPTYDAVQKLAHGLGIDVPQLFTPPVDSKITGRRAITRSGEGRHHITTTYEHVLLAEDISRKKMLPYRAIIRARDFAEFEDWVRHDGEEFLYVLSGSVQLLTEYYAPVELEVGDTAYYDASMGHCVVSTSEEDAVILWVTSL